MDAGVTIPNGFVVKADALNHFMTESSLHSELSQEQFKELFMKAPIPEQLTEEIIISYKKLKQLTGSKDLAVAVRSSSSAEDLQDASFAGQYDTILNVRDEEQLLHAVKQCWASVFSEHARDYAAQKDISLEDFPMGILVQQMVYPDVAGVIFSINPITESKDEIIINASYGLGESIVSGIVTPDTFIVNKQSKAMYSAVGYSTVKTAEITAKSCQNAAAHTATDVTKKTQPQILPKKSTNP